jgi:hypothetical protein
MELIPHNWNVIVVGLWNKAILVPNFVSENIFGNLTGATFNVQIPVNLIGPPRIKNGDFVFIPDNQQIIIEIENCTIENLLKAMDYAKKSIEVLPLTPFFASGFNINYEIRDINTTVLSNIMNSKIDNILSHQDYNIIDKKIVRTLSFNGGQINIIMDFINAVNAFCQGSCRPYFMLQSTIHC